MALTANEQVIFDAVPETGSVNYRDLYTSLITSGNQRVLREFHAMRRAGKIVATNVRDEETGQVETFISRPVAAEE